MLYKIHAEQQSGSWTNILLQKLQKFTSSQAAVFCFFVIADPKRGSFIYNPCRYNIFSLIPCPRMPSKHIPIVNVWYQEWEDIFNLLFSGLSYVYVNQPKGRTLLFFPQSRQRLTCFPADRPEDSLRWSVCADCVVAFFFFSRLCTEKARAIWQKQAQLENNSV